MALTVLVICDRGDIPTLIANKSNWLEFKSNLMSQREKIEELELEHWVFGFYPPSVIQNRRQHFGNMILIAPTKLCLLEEANCSH
jgi:hypothetical protein